MYSEKKKPKVLQTLSDLSGHISNTCKAHQISRKTFYEWKKEDEAFCSAVDDIVDHVVDTVESSLYKNALDGNVTAQIYFLNNKGRNRGWRASYEVTGKDGEPISLPAINIQVVQSGSNVATSEDELPD